MKITGLRPQLGRLLVGLFVLLSVGLVRADYAAQWGPVLGTQIPVLEAPDQSGDLRDLSNLSGKRGFLLFLNRSADW
jgi:hypothetical protein